MKVRLNKYEYYWVSQAKAALCRCKKLQETVDKRNQALMNIQTLKIQLDQAKTDSKVRKI